MLKFLASTMARFILVSMKIFIGHIDRQMGNTLHRDTSAAELIDDAAILFQSGCRAPSDAGASSGNNDHLVGFSHHDFPPENVDLVRVYRIARRLSIRIAGMWKSTGINLRKFSRRLASLFLHSQCQLALENETLRKYTVLY